MGKKASLIPLLHSGAKTYSLIVKNFERTDKLRSEIGKTRAFERMSKVEFDERVQICGYLTAIHLQSNQWDTGREDLGGTLYFSRQVDAETEAEDTDEEEEDEEGKREKRE